MKFTPVTLFSSAVVLAGLSLFALSFVSSTHAQCAGGTEWEHVYTIETNPYQTGTAAHGAWEAVYGQSRVVESSYQIARIAEGTSGGCEEPEQSLLPSAAIIAVPATIDEGQSAELTWTSTNASACTGTNFSTGGATSGTVTVTPSNTTNYSVACSNSLASATAQTTVTVNTAGTLSATLTADPATVATGGASTLFWSSENAESCSIDQGVGSVTPNTPGSQEVSPAGTTTYTLTCINASGEVTVPATVTVTGPDLTASAVSVSAVTEGDEASLSATITNGGVVSTGVGFTSVFQIDSDADHAAVDATRTDTSPALSASGTDEIAGTYTFSTAGTWYVRACADGNASLTGTVAESNEGNNCGPWTTVTVSASSAAVSCTVSDTTIAAGETVTYTAVPTGGAGAPYTWTDTPDEGDTLGSGTTVHRTYDADGVYAMQVSATGAGSVGFCPNVTVGATTVCTGTPTVTITASPTRVEPNTDVTLTWNGSNFDGTCTITGPGVNQTVSASSCTLPSASITTNVTSQSVYTITCPGVTETEVVNVIPKVEEF